MQDREAMPLTDEERAELEQLRAEKAAREEAERARRERAELEELRRAARAEAAPAPTPEAAPPARRPRRADEPACEPTFGQRMVMTPESDGDIPGMAPAQKIVIAVCALCAVGGMVWVVFSNAGLVG